MISRPTTLSPEEKQWIDSEISELETRVLEHVEQLLADVDYDPLEEQLYRIAFVANDALPRRSHRPKIETAFLVEQLYLAYAPDGDDLDPLLEFTIAVIEYYDIFDDILDGDVTAAYESDVVLTTQLLMPLFVRRLTRLGPDAVTFWTDRAIALVEAPLAEIGSDPALDEYTAIVARQADMFGFVTGLAAIVADGDRDEIERSERLGRVFYQYEQFLLDREQNERDDTVWNLWQLTTEQEARALIDDLALEFRTLSDELPDRRAQSVRALVAHDLDAWLDSIED